jgi:hypothetical protein
VIEDSDGDVNPVGPLPGDRSIARSEHRIVAASREISRAGLEAPRIFEFPHYCIGNRLPSGRSSVLGPLGRSTYFADQLSGRRSIIGGRRPILRVRDVYGTRCSGEPRLRQRTPGTRTSSTPRDHPRCACGPRRPRWLRGLLLPPFLDLEPGRPSTDTGRRPRSSTRSCEA